MYVFPVLRIRLTKVALVLHFPTSFCIQFAIYFISHVHPHPHSLQEGKEINRNPDGTCRELEIPAVSLFRAPVLGYRES